MKPGDIIEFRWKWKVGNAALFNDDERLWSTTMMLWTTAGSHHVHMLVSIDDECFSWLNKDGMFHACLNDSLWHIVKVVD